MRLNMSQPEIKINDNDIAYAELTLFDKEGAFDDEKRERRAFIKNLETIDLQAVPGSGKTTTLLAKLIILGKHLPFEDGSGILVISHTNAAIDEIKNKIGVHCPKIFTYPNFVGTIQSFVDQFLAIPYYSQRFGRRPHRIDDDIYEENVYSPHEAYAWLRNNPYQKDKVLYKSRLNENEELVFGFNYPGSFPLRIKTSDTYQSLLKMKQELREKGFLCFDDAYILAKKAIETYPILKLLLQKRFHYVFVDEMQDMDSHQYNLLEQLFFNDGNGFSIYQRIGDKNQAIFSGEVKIEDIWTTRNTTFQITGSRRLSPSIAKAVQSFGLISQEICGCNDKNKDGVENNIPPHAILFDDDSVKDVIPKFCELVKKYKDEGKIPQNHKYPFKAIAWRSGKDGKFGLKNYWEQYEPLATKSQNDHPCLKSYILFANKNKSHGNSLRDIHKSIVGALLKILRLEGVINPDSNKYFTAASLNKHLKEQHVKLYERFRLRIYGWCLDVYRGHIEKAYQEMKQAIPKILKFCFNIELDKAINFVNSDECCVTGATSKNAKKIEAKDNVYKCKKTNIEVEIGTVHSVKGRTNTATLYMESYYEKDGRGVNAKSYESQRLANQFKGENINSNAGKRTKQSAKMVYVGFSRPTHLLCFAVHKARCDENIFIANGWQISKVYKDSV